MVKFRNKYKQSYKWETVYCYICGTAITDKRDYTLDHEPPKSRQTELGASQLFPCCKKCNHEKGALTLSEYRQWLELERKRNGQKVR